LINGGTGGNSGAGGASGTISVTVNQAGGILINGNVDASGGAAGAAGVGGTAGQFGAGGNGGNGGVGGTGSGTGSSGTGGTGGSSGDGSAGLAGSGTTGGIGAVGGSGSAGSDGIPAPDAQPSAITITAPGPVGINGYVKATAGNDLNLADIFNASLITINGSSVAIYGTPFDATSAGFPAESVYGGSDISISAPGTQVVDSNSGQVNQYDPNLDLTSTSTANTVDIIANPAGFSTAAGLGDNGAVGGLDSAAGPATPDTSAAPTVVFIENGATKSLTGPGVLVTPSERIAAIQASTLVAQTLVIGSSKLATGGSFDFNDVNVPAIGNFDTFVLPANVTANVNTTNGALSIQPNGVGSNGTATISGTLNFPSGGSLTADTIGINSGGKITSASDLQLIATTGTAGINAINIASGASIAVTGTGNLLMSVLNADSNINGVGTVSATGTLTLLLAGATTPASATLTTQVASLVANSTGASVTVNQTGTITLLATDGTNIANLAAPGTLTVNTQTGGGSIIIGQAAGDVITADGNITLKVGGTDVIGGPGQLSSLGGLNVTLGTVNTSTIHTAVSTIAVTEVGPSASLTIFQSGDVTLLASSLQSGHLSVDTVTDGFGGSITIGQSAIDTVTANGGIILTVSGAVDMITGPGKLVSSGILNIAVGSETTAPNAINTAVAGLIALGSGSNLQLTQTGPITLNPGVGGGGVSLGGGALTVDTSVGHGSITIGSSAADTVVANGGITLKVAQSDTISGPGQLQSTGALNLTMASGSANVSTAVASGSFTSTSGNITLNQTGDISVTSGTTTGGSLSITTQAGATNGTITAAGSINTGTGGLSLIANNGIVVNAGSALQGSTITLHANGGALAIQANATATGAVNLLALTNMTTGTGVRVSGTNLTLNAPTIGGGSAFGTAASNSITLAGTTITIDQASNHAAITLDGIITEAGSLTYTGDGAVNTGSGGINTTAISIQTTSGDITVPANITGATGVTLHAAGSITGAGSINGNALSLTTDTGNIGGSTPLTTSAGVSIVALAPQGSININQVTATQPDINLEAQASPSKDLTVVTDGKITLVTAPVTGNNISLTSGTGKDIVVNQPITASAAVSLTAGNSITDTLGSGSALITGSTVSLAATAGNIGNSTTDPIVVSTPSITVSAPATGNIFIKDLFSSSPITLSQSGSATGTISVVADSSINVGSDLNATTIGLDSTGGINNGTHSINGTDLTIGTGSTSTSNINAHVNTLTTTGTGGIGTGGNITFTTAHNLTLLSQNTNSLIVNSTANVGISTSQTDTLTKLVVNANAITLVQDLGTTTPPPTNSLNAVTLNASVVNLNGHTITTNTSVTLMNSGGQSSTNDLTVQGAGTLNTPRTKISSDLGTLFFTSGSNVQMSGDALIAGGVAVDVSAVPTPVVHSAGLMTVLTPTINGPLSAFTSSSGTPAIVSPTGAGTLSVTGDLVLTQSYNFFGQDWTIIASGNITATTACKSITLSPNPKGSAMNSGSLTIIAGFDFNGSISSSGSLSPGIYDNFTPSATGGSVLLPKVAIKTDNSFAGKSAGDIIVVAAAGTGAVGTQLVLNPGLISLGVVTAKATSTGQGGNVTLIGQGGVSATSISTVGGTGGSITLTGAQPDLQFAVVFKGQLVGVFGPAVSSKPLADNNGAALVISSALTANGLTGHGGNVTITADSQIFVGGNILTSGTNGGNVYIASDTSSVTVKSGITTSALNVLSGTAGNAGNITIGDLVANIAPASVAVGSLIAKGASNAGGNAGNGGNVDIEIFQDANNQPIGSVTVNGFIDTRGGAATSKTTKSNGGNGGSIKINAATLAVTGVTSGASIIASGGAGAAGGSAGSGNTIKIDTWAMQSLPAAFDLTSKIASIPFMPGGMFSIKGGAPVNGVAGSIVSTNSLSTKQFIFSTNLPPANSIVLTVHGTANVLGTTAINELDATSNTVQFGPAFADPVKGTRTMITPAQAVAFFQASHGYSVSVIPNSPAGNINKIQAGGITANQVEVNNLTFSKFVVPAGLANMSLNLTGSRPTLNFSAGVTIPAGATINFVGPIGFLNVNAGAFVNNGTLQDTGGTIIIGGTNPKWTNNGLISADFLSFARPSSSALSFVTGIVPGTSTHGNLNISDLLLSPSADVGMSMTFTGAGTADSNFTQMNVDFASMPLPLLYQTAATGIANNANTARTVKLTFSTTGATAPVNVNIGGALNAASITLTSSTVKVGTSTLQVPLSITDGTSLNSQTALAITAAGTLTVGTTVGTPSGVFLTSGSLKSSGGTSGVDWTNQTTLAKTDIVKAGAMSLTSSTGDVLFGDGSGDGTPNILVNGSNLTITSKLGKVDLGGLNTYRVMGGNLIVLAKSNVIASGNGQNNYQAEGITGAKSGGIELGGGGLTSTLISAFGKLAGKYGTPAGLVGSPTITPAVGTGFRGVLVFNAASGPTTMTGATDLNFAKGGIMVFDGAAGGKVTINSGTFTTVSTSPTKPIGFESTTTTVELVVDTGDDCDDDSSNSQSVERAVSF
jgi:hypothetical protein